MKDSCRSWFCVWNNPQECYPDLEPPQIAEEVLKIWVEEHPTRTGAVAYCISKDGLKHLHMVLEDSGKARFSALKKLYPKAHLEPTRGNKAQAEDYINKRGKFEEKGEEVLYIARYGEIKGTQGARRDLGIIEELIDQGKTPAEIMDMSFSFRRYEGMIKSAYFAKRSKETPFFREVNIIWHVGESGTGKTYAAKQIVDEFGEDTLYMVNDYSSGGMDAYMGQKILFLDEFRGQIPYHVILSWLDGYKVQVHARYSNVLALWNEVHISSVVPPEKVYETMVFNNRDIDTSKQLFRRINTIMYHWKDKDGFHQYALAGKDYRTMEDLRCRALGIYDEFQPVDEAVQMELGFT